MKHIISHAQGGHIQLATFDEETEELVQFGQLIWPEGFGLTECAVLATNLTDFLGLNGKPVRSRKTAATKQAALPSGNQPSLLDEPEPRRKPTGRPPRAETYARQDRVRAYLAAHPNSTIGEMGQAWHIDNPSNSWIRKAVQQLMAKGEVKRYGLGSHDDPHSKPFTYSVTGVTATPSGADTLPASRKGVSTKARARPENRVKRFISDDEVLAVIDQYPDGITARQIGERIWRTVDHGEGDAPRWVRRSVENRLAMMQHRGMEGKTPLPFRLDYRDEGKGPGPTKYMLPSLRP